MSQKINSIIKPLKRALPFLLPLYILFFIITALNRSEIIQDGELPDDKLPNFYFPAVHITTHGEYVSDRGIPVHRNDWGDITISLSNTDPEFQFENRVAQIRGRGNSSWVMDKQPFRIRFGSNERYSMLDSNHEARHWTFIANHSDKSLMRNYSAYHLASLLDGMSVAPFARFVDVYFNNEYWGVYMLSIQTSEIAEGRINLTYNSDPTLSEFLIELDARAYQDQVEGVDFVTVNDRHYDILFPSGSDLTTEHVEYVRNFITKIHDLTIARDNTIFDHINLESFVDFYIVQELYKNPDVGILSVFMQIRGQGEDRNLEMGPVWDFDIAAGNAYYQQHDENCRYRYRPEGHWVAALHPWYRELMQMPTFFDAVAARWNEVRDVQIRQTIEHIQHKANQHQIAFERNFERWPILGSDVWSNPGIVIEIDTFLGQVEYLMDFLERRSSWLDAVLYSQESFNSGATAITLIDGIPFEYFYTTDVLIRQIPNGFYSIGGHTFYYIDGIRLHGWAQHDEELRYFHYGDNRMVKGWGSIGGYLYYFDPETGQLKTGWNSIGDSLYYLDSESGRMRYRLIPYHGDISRFENLVISEYGV